MWSMTKGQIFIMCERKDLHAHRTLHEMRMEKEVKIYFLTSI